MSNELREYIGFPGCGNSLELDLIRETDKAYEFISPDFPDKKFWLPKSVFDDSGSLTESGVKLYYQKVMGRG